MTMLYSEQMAALEAKGHNKWRSLVESNHPYNANSENVDFRKYEADR